MSLIYIIILKKNGANTIVLKYEYELARYSAYNKDNIYTLYEVH